MFKEYVSKQDICKALATYKVGDTVTLLADQELNKGVVEKGTTCVVTEVEIIQGITVPKLFAKQLPNCIVNCDRYVFRYRLMADNTYFYCLADSMELGTLTPEQVKNYRTKKASEKTTVIFKYALKAILFYLLCVVLWFISLYSLAVFCNDNNPSMLLYSVISAMSLLFSLIILLVYLIMKPIGTIRLKKEKGVT